MNNKDNDDRQSENRTENLISEMKKEPEANTAFEQKNAMQEQHTDPAQLFNTLIETNIANVTASEKLADYIMSLNKEVKDQTESIAQRSEKMEMLLEIEQRQREEFLHKIPESVPASLSEKSVSAMTDFEKTVSTSKKLLYNALALFLIALLTTVCTMYASFKFYKTSVRSRQEIRESVMTQIEKENKILVDKDVYEALSNQGSAIKRWSEKNPQDSKSFFIYYDGYLSHTK